MHAFAAYVDKRCQRVENGEFLRHDDLCIGVSNVQVLRPGYVTSKKSLQREAELTKMCD
jgi:hypothetical protein